LIIGLCTPPFGGCAGLLEHVVWFEVVPMIKLREPDQMGLFKRGGKRPVVGDR
jgi:hypothetical protein